MAEKQKLSSEEEDIIAALRKRKGRDLTAEEIHLALEQARHIGEL